MPSPSLLHALPRKLFILLALVVVVSAAACSPENSRACEVDANCFVDERCIAGFCQFDPHVDEDAEDEDADADEPDADADAEDDADQPDAEDTNEPDAEEDTDADTDEDTDTAPPLSCLDHQSICDGRCVDLQYDATSCGNCATTCDTDFECFEGACIELISGQPHTGTIVTRTTAGFATDLTLDRSGRPHITYVDHEPDSPSVHYVRWTGERWENTLIEVTGGDRPTRIALDPLNRPHIVFGDPTSPHAETLSYASRNASGWFIETIATPRSTREFDLALAPDGSPRVVYIDANDAVTLATRTGPNQWQHTLIDNQNTAGTSIAIAVDQNARTHVAYQRFTSGGELIYAISTDNGWNKTPLATAHNGGLGISMVLDPLGGAHIAARAHTPSNPAILYLTNARGDDPDDWSEEVYPLSSNASEASTSIDLMLGGAAALIGFQHESSAHLLYFFDNALTALESMNTAPTSNTAVATRNHIDIHAALQAPGGGLYYFTNQ